MELSHTFEERFVFTSKAKNKVFTLLGVGALLFILGIVLLSSGFGSHAAEHGAAGAHGHAEAFDWTQRLYVNLWHNVVFFSGVAVMGIFFVSYNYVAYAGWSAGFLRIPMSFGSVLPYLGAIGLIVFFLGKQHIFHWTHDGITEPTSHHYDSIIAGKSAFLNVPFFLSKNGCLLCTMDINVSFN